MQISVFAQNEEDERLAISIGGTRDVAFNFWFDFHVVNREEAGRIKAALTLAVFHKDREDSTVAIEYWGR